MFNIDSIRAIHAVPRCNHRDSTSIHYLSSDRYMTRKEIGINTEKKIIKELKENPAISCVNLAKRMNMSPAGAQCAVKRLLKKALITREKPKGSQMFFL